MGTKSSFRGVLLMYYRVALNRVFTFWQISGCEQPYNVSQIPNLNNLLYFIRLEGLSPRVERKILIHIVELTQRT
jgi:hypothetical protein